MFYFFKWTKIKCWIILFILQSQIMLLQYIFLQFCNLNILFFTHFYLGAAEIFVIFFLRHA